MVFEISSGWPPLMNPVSSQISKQKRIPISPTLGYKERPVQIHRSRAFPGSVWHRQEFSEGAYPDIANEYIFR